MCKTNLTINARALAGEIDDQKFCGFDLIKNALRYYIFMFDFVRTHCTYTKFLKAVFYRLTNVSQSRFGV